MKVRPALILVLLNALVAVALFGAYTAWIAPRAPRLAVLDVNELYRLKEAQVTAALIKRDATDEERATALMRASTFGAEMSRLIESLPAECQCLVFARGALVGPGHALSDLTPEVRRRLGL